MNGCQESGRRGAGQQGPPARTRKKASISASVPKSPSALKSALLVQGSGGHVPARQEKNASMSASVPRSPSQLKSALPQQENRSGSSPVLLVPGVGVLVKAQST